jgi:uncharacterized surface protein with fasciclin (FAS1) repeats
MIEGKPMKIQLILAASAFALVAACTPAKKEETAPAQPAAAEAPAAPVAVDIVDTAVANGSFNTLATALKAAGLVETLKGAGPFTVFAPTDAAFTAIPAADLENLLKPENKDKLAAILTYHVVPGRIMAADLAGKTQDVVTVNGKPVKVDATGGSVKVGDATVTTADVAASNGVIHVIDKVIMPPAK